MQNSFHFESDFKNFDDSQKITNFKDLSSGCDQFVFLVETNLNKKYILKRPRREPEKIENEVFATNLLIEKTDVPTPRVLYYSKETLIETFIEGRLLEEEEEENIALFKELGTLISKIHSVKIEGFGKIQYEKGTATFSNEIEFALSCLNPNDEDFKLHPLTKSIDVPDVFSKIEVYFDSSKSVLLHGDVTNKNIITDGLKISGIIDYGDLVAGPPEYDLAMYNLHLEKQGVWNSFLEGYGKNYDQKKLDAYVFLLGSWLLTTNNIPMGSERYRKYLESIRNLGG